ncbi:hypothetical protein BDV32DRAFT_106740 [Aspergillus pseudonomiae]|nr:hypothetical protein BDV32DRAFT_106740 [Aspergillus pseudonomiae]
MRFMGLRRSYLLTFIQYFICFVLFISYVLALEASGCEEFYPELFLIFIEASQFVIHCGYL